MYSLDEIKDFLINNRISLSVLYLTNERNDELDYLSSETDGSSTYLYRGNGAKGYFDNRREKKSGFYVISYDSVIDSSSGDGYNSVELEVNFIRKSGRSELGFYPPVEAIK